MAIFSYTALKNNKTIVKGNIEAQDASQARRKLRDMSLTPTSIVDSTQSKKGGKKSNKGLVQALSLREKIDFTSTLEILTSTGIPIIEALMFIEQNSDSAKFRNITGEFRKQIIGGATLGESLAH